MKTLVYLFGELGLISLVFALIGQQLPVINMISLPFLDGDIYNTERAKQTSSINFWLDLKLKLLALNGAGLLCSPVFSGLIKTGNDI